MSEGVILDPGFRRDDGVGSASIWPTSSGMPPRELDPDQITASWRTLEERMTSARDVIEIARQMIERYGEAAADEMERRSQHHREHGEHEGAQLWAEVARAVRRLQGRT